MPPSKETKLKEIDMICNDISKQVMNNDNIPDENQTNVIRKHESNHNPNHNQSRQKNTPSFNTEYIKQK